MLAMPQRWGAFFSDIQSPYFAIRRWATPCSPYLTFLDPICSYRKSLQVMSEPLIRIASATDLPAVCAVEDDSFPSPYPRFLLERLLEDCRETFLVATSGDGVIVGYCVALIDGNSAHLISIAVRRNYRHRGYGTAMIKRIISQLLGKEVGFVRLEVGVNNREAISLYSKNGFEKQETLPNYYSNGSDAIRMRLALGDSSENIHDGDN